MSTNLNINSNAAKRPVWHAPMYLLDEIVTGTDSDFTGAGNWVTGLGSPTFDINSTVANNLYIDFSSGNQAIKLENTLTIGEDNYCEVRLKKISGLDTLLTFGHFAGTETEAIFEINHQIDEYSIHKFTLRNATSAILYLGSITAENNGGVFAVDYVKVWTIDNAVETNETALYKNMPTDFNLNDFLSSVDETKKLYKFGVFGNSIMANSYGGVAFNDEGETLRPPRLTSNNIPRRIYDYLVANNTKWTVPTFKRIDHVDWVLSTPANWTQITGSEFLIPDYTTANYETRYKYNQTALDYAEIVIPDGFENCALIFHADDNEFGQDYDDVIAATINGGDISSYGNSVINTYKAKYGASDRGNPFFHEQYLDLPSGANTIRITKSNTSKTMTFWGAMYWTGNAIWLINSGVGGNNMFVLYKQFIQSILIDNEIDTLFFEVPGMNEAGDANTLNFSQKYFEYINNLSKQLAENVLIYGTHPFGTNPNPPPIANYYTLFSVPNTLKEIYNRMKHTAYRQGDVFLDVSKRFESRIIADGGTLEGGEGGTTYTTDGQHNNTLGAGLFSDDITNSAIKSKLE